MAKYRIGSTVLILFLSFLLYATIAPIYFPNSLLGDKGFKFGLDLVGGTELIYRADVSELEPSDIGNSLQSLRDVIERRVNVFGVSEPLIQIEEAGIISGNPDYRLIVELPGVEDIEEAVALIGKTPLLEFRLQKPGLMESLESDDGSPLNLSFDDMFVSTGLTGRLLKRSQLEFDQTTGKAIVALEFNDEGKELLSELTKNNLGEILAIFLDNVPISTPVIQDEIKNGQAVISGDFDALEARTLVRDLNYGALPLPIELISTQTVGATLGEKALSAGMVAGVWGFVLIALFLIIWYRLPGLIAVLALFMYIALSLSIFKFIPVTLTAAGIAGFILSIGMAVDANILIFERMKEELRKGKNLIDATNEGFKRAWLSIRDSNISSIITAIVLFWLGTSSVKGFALTLGIGVTVSMFTAITVSRTFLLALNKDDGDVWSNFLFGVGLSKGAMIENKEN